MWQQTLLFSRVAPLLTSTAGLPRALPPIGLSPGGTPNILPSGASEPPRASIYPPLTPRLAGVLPEMAFLKWIRRWGSALVCYRSTALRLAMARANTRPELLYAAAHPPPDIGPLAPRLTTLKARPLGPRQVLQELAKSMDPILQVRLVGSRGRAPSRHLIPRLGRMIPLLMSLRLLFRSVLDMMLPPIGGTQL